MTWALCLNCGQKKFGALCDCPKCGAGSTGNVGLDIAFSDHRISVGTIEAFGDVVRAIRRVSDDEELRFGAFMRYISLHHPDILGYEQQPDQQRSCDELLAQANPPMVVAEASPRASKSTSREGRAWWKFW